VGEWYEFLTNAAFLAGSAFALRELLIAVISLWSLRADDRGRKHALALLKALRVPLRRPPPEVAAAPPAAEPPPPGEAPGQ